MTKVRLTNEFRFEMAHALLNYNGLCRNIHGHSYVLYVTVIGEPCVDIKSSKLGMVMDFGDLKRIVNKEIISVFDHSLIFNKNTPILENLNILQMVERYYLVDYQPTCENMLIDFVERIKKYFFGNVKLHSMKLYETVGSFAEWHASDN